LAWPAISGPPLSVVTIIPCWIGVILLMVLSASPRAISSWISYWVAQKHSRNEAIMYAAFPGVELVMGGIIRFEAATEICQTWPVRESGRKLTVVVEGYRAGVILE
jgi:hypothetical protein